MKTPAPGALIVLFALFVVLPAVSKTPADVDVDEPAEAQASPETVKQLISALSSEDPEHRLVAAEELKDYPSQAASHGAVAPLVRIVRDDGSLPAREAALWTLGEIGMEAGEEAVPVLLELIESPQPGRVRGIAAWALGRMDPPLEQAAKPLIMLACDLDEFNRAAAAEAIGGLGEPVLPILMISLTEMEGGSHFESCLVEAIGSLGPDGLPAVPMLKELRARTHNEWVKDDIDRALQRIDPTDDKDQVALLVAEMEGAPSYTRYLNIVDLGEMGPAAKKAVPAIYDALEDPETARVALEALVAILPESKCPEVTSRGAPLLALEEDWERDEVSRILASCGDAGRRTLEEAITDPRAEIRAAALTGLSGLEANPDTFKILKRLLQKDDAPKVRAGAANVLAGHGEKAWPLLKRAIEAEEDPAARGDMIAGLAPQGERALPLLRQELQREEGAASDAAATALEGMGAIAAPAVPDLLAASKRGHSMGVYGPVIGAIGDPAVPYLIEALEHDNREIREQAAYQLGSLRASPELAVPVLARALDDEFEDTRQWAAWSLGLMGPDAAGAVEDLRASLTDPEPWVRRNAAEALGKIGEEAHPAIPDLIDMLAQKRSYGGAEEAAEALGVFGPAAAAAVRPLAEALDNEDDDYLRRASARALIEIGISTPFVVEQLRGALDDPRARVRWAAADALLLLGDESDVIEAKNVIRKAPDEAWDEDAKIMQEFNESLQWLEE